MWKKMGVAKCAPKHRQSWSFLWKVQIISSVPFYEPSLANRYFQGVTQTQLVCCFLPIVFVIFPLSCIFGGASVFRNQ